ncbi:hypothetical protein HanRHA438_Chr04g0155671 [Helianthus annuus]|nr:hypothetical protein HanIR_Chr04g0156641 [Helianthus annuus]KAJ0794969.1 hypothetical protein HanPI659440_Chr04g0145011 [Helianthus annuus]KAJ0925088.1 hypothetical protein HanRHA438_Chr04g0155671 [Helianthus annuus]
MFFVIDYAYQMFVFIEGSFGLWFEIEWQQYEICSSFISLREAEEFSITMITYMSFSCVMGDPYGASKVSGWVR